MPVLEAPSWTTDVERGPNWLFLRVHAPAKTSGDGNELADVVWQTMQQHLANRVVLEMDDLKMLNSRLIGQLVLLQKRICTKGGTLRVCGLSEASQAALHSTRLDTQLPCYRDRTDALMGTRPGLPR
jgi:anti-anti-sigma factor